MKIICFGPGPIFKGGISNYNTSLAKSLSQIKDCDVDIVSWSQQYPAIIPREFKDLKSKADLLQGTNIQVYYELNYNNPITWYKTAQKIKALRADAVIIQWAIAIQGLPLSVLVNQLLKFNIKVIFDLHFVFQKEQSRLDHFLTKIALKSGVYFVTHALTTYKELKTLLSKNDVHLWGPANQIQPISNQKYVLNLFHPIYNMFEIDPTFEKDKLKKELNLNKHVFLFFGFIRKYKGLHNAILAFKLCREKNSNISLLICGESFWRTLDQKKWSTKIKSLLFDILKSLVLKKKDNEQNYNPLALIKELDLEKDVKIFNDFIPNEDVNKYFQVSDAVVLFYEYATPSGVESIGYNFKMPILATKVGHFSETVEEGITGYLAKPNDIQDMARVMEKFIHNPINRENVAKKRNI